MPKKGAGGGKKKAATAKVIYVRTTTAAPRARLRGKGGYQEVLVDAAARPLAYAAQGKAYKGYARGLGAALGGAAGSSLGTMIAPGIGTTIGGIAGAMAGGAAGARFSQLTGFGDYRIKKNSLLKNEVIPSFGEDSIRVRKRELIAHVDASTAFVNNSYVINPGNKITFPWLSAIAQNYEQYHMNGLVFQFRSTASDAIASTTNLGLGQVIMATDYNSENPPYTSDIQMLGSTFANSGKPSMDMMHAIECAPQQTAQKLFYVDSGIVPATTGDSRLSNMGVFQIATQDMPAVYTGMGQLWVSYDVTFVKSQNNNQVGSHIATDFYDFATGGTAAQPFNGGTLRAGSDAGTTLTGGAAAITVNFPDQLENGTYLVEGYAQSAAQGPWASSIGALTNCTLEPNTSSGVALATTSLNFHVIAVVTITAANASIVLNMIGPAASSINFSRLIVTHLNGDIF